MIACSFCDSGASIRFRIGSTRRLRGAYAFLTSVNRLMFRLFKAFAQIYVNQLDASGLLNGNQQV